MPSLTFSRRSTFAALTAMLLAACGSANGDSPSAAGGSGALDEMVLGDRNAPVTLIEYASVTCGACYQFHMDVMPTIKERFVEPGHVQFIFREFPTAPVNVAVAGFAVARCAGPDRYYDVIDDLFESQQGILLAARQGAVRPALEAVAERHGIVGQEAFDACLSDRDIRQAIADVVLTGEEFGVDSTPTLILQGEKLDNTIQSRTPEGLSALIEAELAAVGVVLEADSPADSPEEETSDEASLGGEADSGSASQ